MSVWTILLILLSALLPRGAQTAPALNVVLLLVSTAFLGATVVEARRAGLAAAAERLLRGTSLAALLALPLFVLLQLAAELIFGASAAVFATAQSATILISLALFYLLVRSTVTDASSFRRMLGMLAVVGGAEATYAILNLLSGNEYVVLWRREIFFNSATGTLTSRNHFAYLMEMFLPVSIAFAAMLRRSRSKRSSESSAETARAAIAMTITLLCMLALVFSHSRMGIISMAVSCGAIFVLNRLFRPANEAPGSTGGAWPTLVATSIGIGVVLAAAIGLDSVLDRFLHLDADLVEGRWPIWQATLAMFIEHPFFGHGWGTFQLLLPSFRPAPTGFFYTHAHNDYFEVLAESGLVGLALAAWLLFFLGRRLIHSLAAPLSDSQRSVVFWLGISLTSVLFHSLADYGLRTPGVAFTFAATAALFSRVTEEPQLVSRGRRRSRGHKS